MPDQPAIPAENIPAPEPSFQDIKNFFADKPADNAPLAVKTDPAPVVLKTETPEPKADTPAADAPTGQTPVTEGGQPEGEPAGETAAEKHTEAAPGTASEEQIEPEPELDPGVRKRIAQEVRKQAAADRAITEAVSARKAAEARLKDLTADKPGSEPAPITAPAAETQPATPRPVLPVLDTYPGTFEEFKIEEKAKQAELEAWIVAETTRKVTEAVSQSVDKQLTERELQRNVEQKRADAEAVHGADFPSLMDTLAQNSPEGLQKAISGLDNWSGVAVQLAQKPEELAALVAIYQANPAKAVAQLGRIEFQLEQAAATPAPKPPAIPARAAASPKPLPDPAPRVGGSASAAVPLDLNTLAGDMPAFKAEMKRRGVV